MKWSWLCKDILSHSDTRSWSALDHGYLTDLAWTCSLFAYLYKFTHTRTNNGILRWRQMMRKIGEKVKFFCSPTGGSVLQPSWHCELLSNCLVWLNVLFIIHISIVTLTLLFILAWQFKRDVRAVCSIYLFFFLHLYILIDCL